ncbi:MAG: TonB-dependent receptor [Parasphingorhabdus sp.]|nr:TonB-dependent receptor [Parasphingorhabdus sp.]
MVRVFTNQFKIALSLGTAAAFTAYPAWAQQSPTEDEAAEGEEIVVTGSILQSQQASVKAKKEATNVVDVASADSVGRFPDENTAAALARLPGVAVQRDQGQARYIQVRGAPNRWTSVSIDGIPQTGVDESGDTRAYRFDSVPAVLLSELRVNKSLTSDLTAEAITANVDMRTYSPLSSRGLNVSGDIGYGLMDLGNGEQRQGSLRASYSNGTIGIMVGGSHYKRYQTTDNREAEYDALGPLNIDIRSYILDRENNSLFGTFEYAPSDSLKFHARGIYTEFKDDEQRNAYQLDLNRGTGTRTLLTGDLVGVRMTAAFNDAEYRNKNTIFATGADYDDGNGFMANLALGYTKTENTTYLPLVQASTSGTNSPSLTYDRSGDPRFPIVQLFSTVSNGGVLSRGAPISSFNQTSLDPASTIVIPLVQGTVSNAYTAKLDLSKELGDVTVKGGLISSRRDIKGNVFQVGGVRSLAGTRFDVNSYVTDRPWNTEFPLGFTLNYVDNPRLNTDLQSVLTELNVNRDDFIPAASRYEQQEKIGAGYYMAQFDLGAVQITGGARLEYYELENSGTAVVGTTATPLTNNTDFLDIFPSLNLRFDAGDNLVFRLAGQRGVTRPAYAAIRVGSSVSDVNQTISGGNPFLVPETTWGLDASAEYYLPGNGIISVAGFYRSVDDVLYSSSRVVGDDLYNSGGVDRSGYRLTSTFNGSNGNLYGVEFNIEHQLDFLPGLLGGFGVQANLTLLGGDFDALQPDGTTVKAPFQGLSDTVANASIFYERDGLSARVSYQWRSDYLDTIGGFGAGEFRAGNENLDVTLRYALNENLTLFADLGNLTNEIYTAYEGTAATPAEVEQIGSRYLFGARFNF